MSSFPDFIIDSSTVELMTKGAVDLIKLIKPEWKNHKSQIFTDGITNKLIGIYENDKKDMILIRIYGQGSELFIDRKTEINNIKMLHQHGFSEPLHAVFGNGIAYGFASGTVTDSDSIITPEIWPIVAKNMAKMHKIKIADTRPEMWNMMMKFLKEAPVGFPNDPKKQSRYEKESMNYDEILREINELKNLLSGDDEIKVGFCHNDLLMGNIVYNKSGGGKISFIDFEYGNVNYTPFDIGNHFSEFVGIMDVMDYEKYYPKEDFQKKWIKVYLQSYYDDENVTDDQIHKMYVLVQKFALCAHLHWGLWALVQAKHSLLDFDFLDYALQRFAFYKKNKVNFLNLK